MLNNAFSLRAEVVSITHILPKILRWHERLRQVLSAKNTGFEDLLHDLLLSFGSVARFLPGFGKHFCLNRCLRLRPCRRRDSGTRR
jgi:hypothetical protein